MRRERPAVRQHAAAGRRAAKVKPLLNSFLHMYTWPTLWALIAGTILVVLLCLKQEDLDTRLRQIFILVSDCSSYLERILTYTLPGICLY
jgi:hypothetical protein